MVCIFAFSEFPSLIRSSPATTHIRYLEMTQQQLQTRLAAAESETNRLRQYVHLSIFRENLS